jgi:hypothetical protein
MDLAANQDHHLHTGRKIIHVYNIHSMSKIVTKYIQSYNLFFILPILLAGDV